LPRKKENTAAAAPQPKILLYVLLPGPPAFPAKARQSAAFWLRLCRARFSLRFFPGLSRRNLCDNPQHEKYRHDQQQQCRKNRQNPVADFMLAPAHPDKFCKALVPASPSQDVTPVKCTVASAAFVTAIRGQQDKPEKQAFQQPVALRAVYSCGPAVAAFHGVRSYADDPAFQIADGTDLLFLYNHIIRRLKENTKRGFRPSAWFAQSPV
jgi:hypothetical protein